MYGAICQPWPSNIILRQCYFVNCLLHSIHFISFIVFNSWGDETMLIIVLCLRFQSVLFHAFRKCQRDSDNIGSGPSLFPCTADCWIIRVSQAFIVVMETDFGSVERQEALGSETSCATLAITSNWFLMCLINLHVTADLRLCYAVWCTISIRTQRQCKLDFLRTHIKFNFVETIPTFEMRDYNLRRHQDMRLETESLLPTW